MHAFLGATVGIITLAGTLAASAQAPAAAPSETPAAQETSVAPVKDQARLIAPDQQFAADPTSSVANASTGTDSDGEPKAESSYQRSEPRGTNPPTSLVELCDTLISSARANDLPVVFFTNLIWQESRFNPSAVSRAGAQGMAQFMPGTAAAAGLENPFDPSLALPASARLLRQLHDQFGNAGLAAAAYNAGPGRILKWLANRASLPRETRDYVATITGRPPEHWRTASAEASFKPSRGLPCNRTAAFAEFKDAAADAATDNEENAEHSKTPHIAVTRNPRASLFAARIKPLPQRVAAGSIQRAPIVYAHRVPVVVPQRAPSSAVQRASADGPRLVRIKMNNASDKKRLATRTVVTITPKSVRLTLVAPEPRHGSHHQKKTATKLALVAPEPGQAKPHQKKSATWRDAAPREGASHNKTRKVRSVRVASN
jgi:soluble lytic murein transglycosylase-like protein